MGHLTRRAASAIAALGILGTGGSCAAPLVVCQYGEVAGMTGELAGCMADDGSAGFTDSAGALWCFEDRDGDDVAEAYLSTVACPALPGDVITFGDCDDEDDNRFPGNKEVCDGLDNDCSGVPSFDDEEDDAQPPSCAPAGSPRLFLRGGGLVDGRGQSVTVPANALVEGELRVRSFLPPGAGSQIAIAVVASWLEPHEAHVSIPPFDPSNIGPGGVLNVEVNMADAGFLTPAELPDGAETAFINILVGSLPTPGHVASLTSPCWCIEDRGGFDACEADPSDLPCPPIWDRESEFDPPPGQPPRQFDLADLGELDLAACASFGAARVGFLTGALGPEGSCAADAAPDCYQIYTPRTVGCLQIKLHLEDAGVGQ